MESIQAQLGLDDKTYGKLRLFNRILISYNDFKQTHEIASLLIEGNLYANYPKENRQLVIALNMAAIVAYARPFLDSGGELAYNRLPEKILGKLNSKEKEVHEQVLRDRNTMMAHSDADANESFPLVVETANGPIMIPKNASAYETVLTSVAMNTLCDMSLKLRECCFDMRRQMEPEMLKVLPKAQIDQTNDA